MMKYVFFFHQHHTSNGIPFYTNSIKAIVKMRMGHPETATKISRYPVIPRDCVRYVIVVLHALQCVMTHIVQLHLTENYSMVDAGLKIRASFPPMADTPSGSVFVNDFVSFRVAAEHLLGRVLLFYCKVNAALSIFIFICMYVFCDNTVGCVCRCKML